MQKDLLMADSYVEKNEIDNAIKLLDNLYSKDKNDCILIKKAEILINSGQRKNAINLLEKIFKQNKKDIDLILKIAYNYFLISDLKKSLKYYLIALEMKPYVDFINFNVGNVYHFLKNDKKAVYYYSIAVNLNPNYVEAINNLGIIYCDSKMYKEAISMHNQAISISPTHPEAYHHLGTIERKQNKDYELSMYYLKKAIKLDPSYLLNHYELALTYKCMNKFDDAKSELEICKNINPNHKDTITELVKLSRI